MEVMLIQDSLLDDTEENKEYYTALQDSFASLVVQYRVY